MIRLLVGLVNAGLVLSAGAYDLAAQTPKCPLSSDPRSAMAWFDGGERNTLRGRVVSARTSDPLPGATVRLFPGGVADWPDSAIALQRSGAYRAVADTAGAFKISEIAGGPYMLVVSASGLRHLRDTVTIGTDGLTLVAVLSGYPRDKICIVEGRPPAT
jgi:hypothetical protein